LSQFKEVIVKTYLIFTFQRGHKKAKKLKLRDVNVKTYLILKFQRGHKKASLPTLPSHTLCSSASAGKPFQSFCC
jgi:hypothetical protein